VLNNQNVSPLVWPKYTSRERWSHTDVRCWFLWCYREMNSTWTKVWSCLLSLDDWKKSILYFLLSVFCFLHQFIIDGEGWMSIIAGRYTFPLMAYPVISTVCLYLEGWLKTMAADAMTQREYGMKYVVWLLIGSCFSTMNCHLIILRDCINRIIGLLFGAARLNSRWLYIIDMGIISGSMLVLSAIFYVGKTCTNSRLSLPNILSEPQNTYTR